MSKKRRYLLALFGVVLVVVLISLAVGCGADEDEIGEPRLSDFCDGAVTVYNVPNTNEPEAAWDDFDAFVVKPDKGCGALPVLYCVYVVGEWHGGGAPCVILEQ